MIRYAWIVGAIDADPQAVRRAAAFGWLVDGAMQQQRRAVVAMLALLKQFSGSPTGRVGDVDDSTTDP